MSFSSCVRKSHCYPHPSPSQMSSPSPISSSFSPRYLLQPQTRGQSLQLLIITLPIIRWAFGLSSVVAIARFLWARSGCSPPWPLRRSPLWCRRTQTEHKQGVLTLPRWSGRTSVFFTWCYSWNFVDGMEKDLLRADRRSWLGILRYTLLRFFHFYVCLHSQQELWYNVVITVAEKTVLWLLVWIVFLVWISVSPPLWVGERAESMCSHFGCPQSTDL